MKQRRGNEQLSRWVRAGLFVALSWWALAGLSFTPPGATPVLAFIVGATALFAPGIAVLIAIVLMALPVLAADIVTGALFLLLGLAAIQYLALGRGRGFLFLGYAFLLAALGPAWAIPALAGLWLGASEGAVVALLACVALQVSGIIAGDPAVGPVVTGAGETVLGLGQDGESLLTLGWLSGAFDDLSYSHLADAFSSVRYVSLLIVQPFIWAAGAAVAGSITIRETGVRRAGFSVAAAAAGVVVTAVASVIAASALAEAPFTTDIVFWTVSALLIAGTASVLREILFPLPPAAVDTPAIPTTQVSLSAEEADVDELLRLIAHAEDELASKHTVNTVVMITDMKSFSAMTEEDGSMVSAKIIQRHRDLLVPLITAAGGSGKSTGGDGLVAAFPDTPSALKCAAAMQQTLKSHNTTHSSERDIIIRVGIATGEVVLDRAGRPFIGSALNMAARVMNLADGGQVFTTRLVADAAGVAGVRTHSHGMFALKNITGTTEVLEVLWWDGQHPVEPRGKDD